MTTLYIAGPMTGLPDNNYPAFHDAERRLRAVGYEVENPASNDGPEYADFMRQGFIQVCRSDGIALLDGWERSVGAMQERTLALWLGMECAPLFTWVSIGTVGLGIEASR